MAIFIFSNVVKLNLPVTTETAKRMSQLPRFENLGGVKLTGIPGCFDIDDFIEFIKKNYMTKKIFFKGV